MKAYELIPTPDKWCQGYDAMDEDGNETAWDDPDAARLCMLAAICRVYPPKTEGYYQALKKLCNGPIRWLVIQNFNDNPHTSHADVLRLLKTNDV
jgi:hypothetical protein